MSSFLALLVSGLAIFFAIKTKPTYDSFESFYTSSYLHGRKPKKKAGWLSGVVDVLLNDGRTRLPPVVIHECIVFLVAVVDSDEGRGEKAYFLGIFGLWIPLVAPVPDQTENPRPSEDNTGVYESIMLEAINLKSSGHHVEAGAKFEHAGLLAGPIESIESYEQAARCFKVAGDLQRATQNYSHAIKLCERHNRYVKAAGLAESLADICTQDDRINALQIAIQCYEQVPDRRASQVRERLAQTLAPLKRYNDASELYFQRSMDLAEDPILMHAARKIWLYGLCCKTLHNQASLKDEEGYPGWFVGTEEHKVFDRWVQYREGSVGEFRTTSDLPQWLLDIPVNDSLC